MNELQVKVLGLLKEIDQLCRENGVEYYLTAGTLLGAVRHKGFIPWDDDADIILTRENWEKLLERTAGKLPEGMVINTQYDNMSLAMTANHYVDTHTTAIYRYDVTNPERCGIMLDVIIMDPVPEGDEARKEYIEALTKHTELSTLPYQYSTRIGKTTNFSLYWDLSKILGKKRILDYIDRKAFHYSDEESAFYVQRFAGSPHFWPKEYFGTPKYVPFEDTMLPIPERAEDSLCISFDDEWMFVPRGGATKSTHEFSVRSLTIPGEYIASDFERHIDREKLIDTYVKRKKHMVSMTDDKFHTELQKDLFMASYIQMIYEKKLAETDLGALVESSDYEALEELFFEYISTQCTSHFLGSSALNGWLNWYRKCNPMLIDIGDEALYAVLVLLVHKQKLSWTGKLLKARKELDRPMPENLQDMDALYGAVKAATSAYDRGDDAQCEEILSQWLARYPENPFFRKLALKERVRHGLSGQELLNAAQEELELFPEDSELQYFQGQAYLELGEREAALEIFRLIVDTTNHGIVLLHIREHLEALLEQEPEDWEVVALWLDLRRACGEEDVPTLKDLMPEEPEAEAETSIEEQKAALPDQLAKSADFGNQLAGDKLSGHAPENAELLENVTEAAVPDQSAVNDDYLDQPKDNDFSEHAAENVDPLEQSAEDDVGQPERVDVPVPQAKKTQRLTDIQKKRLKLLREIAEICEKNQITYSIWGRTLLQAARKGGRYVDTHGELSVVMTPANCKKFMKAFKNKHPKNRYLDSMRTNPQFLRFCIRYCASDSLDFTVARSGCGDRFGMFVTIEILRYPSKDKKADERDLLLEQGWEALTNMKEYSPEVDAARRKLALMCTVLGRKRVAQRLFNHFLNGPETPQKGQYYIKPFWKERVFYPDHWFKYSTELKLEGKPVQVMRLYSGYLTQTFGAKWKTRTFPMTKEPATTRIVDAHVSSKTYLNYLKAKGVDRNAFWDRWYQTGKRYSKVVTLGKETSHYWDVMTLCGERYRLWEKYMPKRLYLIELRNNDNVKRLEKELKEYYKVAMAFSKKDLGLCFDKEIFEILEYWMIVSGKAEQAKLLCKQVPKCDWEPINPPYQIEEAAKGMRRATENDIPAILLYLKRKVHDCIYMYIDIAKYGLENPNMKVWLDSDDKGVKLVVMKYHTSISVYSDRKKWDIGAVAQLIEEEKVGSVTGRRDMIEELVKSCPNYSAEYGSVFRLSTHRDYDFDGDIETATPDDALEIAKLIATDEGIGSYYEIQDLADQLAERMETGMGRSYVIRDQGKIVAHIASYAEFKSLATTGGLIVDMEHRSGVYGGVLESYLVKNLLEENFKVYTFVTARLRAKLFEALGNKQVGEYGKMTRVKEEDGNGEEHE